MKGPNLKGKDLFQGVDPFSKRKQTILIELPPLKVYRLSKVQWWTVDLQANGCEIEKNT